MINKSSSESHSYVLLMILLPMSGMGNSDERRGVEPVRGGGPQPHEGAADVAQGQDQQVVLGSEVLREHVQSRHEMLADLGEDLY